MSMMQSLFVVHPFQLLAGWKFSGHTSDALPGTTFIKQG
jgi:hypothetical protein